MKQPFLQALRRLRKVQDAILNDKLTSNISLEIEAHNSNLVGESYASIFAGRRETPGGALSMMCTVYINNTDSLKDIESKLSQIAEVLNINL